MQVVRHQYELMQPVKATVATTSQLANYNICHVFLTENFTPLPCMRSDEVRSGLVNPANDAAHRKLQGLKPRLNWIGQCRG